MEALPEIGRVVALGKTEKHPVCGEPSISVSSEGAYENRLFH
jgi:hypothetical protein